MLRASLSETSGMYTIVLVNVKRFRTLCGFYAIENKLLLLLLLFISISAPFDDVHVSHQLARH